MAAERTLELTLEVEDEAVQQRLDGYGVTAMRGHERIGALFDFTVTAAQRAADPEAVVQGDELLGGRIALVFREDGQEVRRLHGIVAETQSRGDRSTIVHSTLRLRVVPRHHQLTMVRTQEIHLDLSVPEIIAQKLELHGLDAASRLHLLEPYPKREFVAQHAETDLAFISRLCEHVGISFFSTQEGQGDTLVFVDAEGGFPEVSEPLHSAEARGNGLLDLGVTRRLVSRHYGVDDYHYLTPSADLLGMQELETGWVGGVIEFGSHHLSGGEAAALAAIRAEEARGAQAEVEGTSNAVTLTAGHRYRLDEPPAGLSTILVTEIEHELSQAVGANATEAAPSYRNRFRAAPSGFTYRPPRRTPRPRITGLLTGVIQAGPDGATGGFAQLDEHGRYVVQFHYDAVHVDGLRASHPVRLAQIFAGPNQGMHFPLRPGTEVLIGFIAGDPDRPVIVGAMANPLTRSPVTGQRPNRNRITTGSGITIELSDGR